MRKEISFDCFSLRWPRQWRGDARPPEPGVCAVPLLAAGRSLGPSRPGLFGSGGEKLDGLGVLMVARGHSDGTLRFAVREPGGRKRLEATGSRPGRLRRPRGGHGRVVGLGPAASRRGQTHKACEGRSVTGRCPHGTGCDLPCGPRGQGWCRGDARGVGNGSSVGGVMLRGGARGAPLSLTRTWRSAPATSPGDTLRLQSEVHAPRTPGSARPSVCPSRGLPFLCQQHALLFFLT